MLLFWALNVGIINFRIQPKIYFEKWGSSNGNKVDSPPPPRVFGFYPPRAVLPRQTFLTHCVLHCAVTDSLARGCSWNHGRNTAKCSVVCVYSTRARRAFSCRPGRSVYTIVLVVHWCCLGWHYIVYSNAAAAMACAHCKKKMSGRIGRTSPRQQQQRTMGTKKGGTRRKSSCSPPHENNIVIGWYYTNTSRWLRMKDFLLLLLLLLFPSYKSYLNLSL